LRALKFIFLFAAFAASPALAENDDDFLSEDIGQETKANLKELLILPLQPVWKMAERSLLDEALKNIAAELADSAGYKLVRYNLRVGAGNYKDPESRLRKRWAKDVRGAESSTRRRRFSAAIKAAGRAVRQMLQNPEHVRTPDSYCRSLALTAEGEIRRGKKRKAAAILQMLASSCSDTFQGSGSAVLSDAFEDALAEAVAAVRRREGCTLVVFADEPGATVYLNGVDMGPAPVLVSDLAPGRHLVAVSKAGHKPWGKAVKIGSEKVTLKATLMKPLGGGRKGVLLAHLRNNQMSAQVVAAAAEVLRKEGGKSPYILVGGLAKEEAVVKVRLIAVNRSGRSVALKQLGFDVDFLGLAPEMLGYGDKLKALEKKFAGKKAIKGALIDGLSRPQLEPTTKRWVNLASGGGRARSQTTGPARRRGPLRRSARDADPEKVDAPKRNRRTDRVKEARKREKRSDRSSRDSNRKVVRRGADEEGETAEDRDAPRRRTKKKSERKKQGARGKRKKRSARRGDGWDLGERPSRLRRRRRSRTNWPLVSAAAAGGVVVVVGGLLIYQNLTAAPSAVDVNVRWTP
jgi:hypothetical protein